jgi:hypothetical protein
MHQGSSYGLLLISTEAERELETMNVGLITIMNRLALKMQGDHDLTHASPPVHVFSPNVAVGAPAF